MFFEWILFILIVRDYYLWIEKLNDRIKKMEEEKGDLIDQIEGMTILLESSNRRDNKRRKNRKNRDINCCNCYRVGHVGSNCSEYRRIN